MRRRAFAAALLLAAGGAAAAGCDDPADRVLEVGPGRAFERPSDAAAAARPGDLVRIAAGDYRGDVARWAVDGLRLCGTGGRVRLFADGRSMQGKAIWVIAGRDILVENIDFHDARVPDHNGAGIRAEHAGALTIRRCGFYDNENGILGGRPGATLTIEFSEFARNGYGDGYTHNLYAGELDRLVVRASSFREARVGHQLKSRATESVVEFSYLQDGPAGNSSYLADFPNGGQVLLRGNLWHKGPKAENSSAIAYGAEGLRGEGPHTLTLRHNTLVVDHPQANFLLVRPGAHLVMLEGNLFAGHDDTRLVTGGYTVQRLELVAHASWPLAPLAGAGSIERPDFWPTGRDPGPPPLAQPVDADYRQDAPRPRQLRPLAGPAGFAGALQAPP